MNRNGTDCKNGFEIYNERLLVIKIQILFLSSHCLSLIKPKKKKSGFNFGGNSEEYYQALIIVN